MEQEEMLKKRFLELGERAYRHNQYIFTHFLNLNEQDIFHRARKDMPHIDYRLYGGTEFSERLIARFGSEDMFGYEMDFPIDILLIKPQHEKFADNLDHRDFLGAIMNLGIDRSTIGDIFVNARKACVLCENTVTDYIINELIKVRHTNVSCTKIDSVPEEFMPVYEDRCLSAASERADGVVAAVFNISRSKSTECFRAGKVFVNGGLVMNPDNRLKEGDIVSLRGAGRFIYRGISHTTKKGRLQIIAAVPVKR